MKLPLSWIQEFIKTPDDIGDVLTLAGLEVDSIDEAPLLFSGVVVGEVRDVMPHPDANKLRVATVFDGSEEFQVVCGAPNCRAKMKTAFARVGARVGDMKIKKGKLRGVESCGMLCSGDELGLSDDATGIIEIKGEVGTDLKDMYGETIIEISLTPNLGHCTSVLGIARELSALTNRPYVKKQPRAKSVTKATVHADVDDALACPRYCIRRIKNVKVGPSPEWMVARLEASGVRSINNIVDVTNYVMLETGQPMHAFDAAKVKGDLCVKEAPKELSLTTLDGHERTIPFGTLLIWDDEKPLAVAGVIGGANSEVSETTTEIILEAAAFSAPVVRAASKQLGVRTESSSRFEKGVDQNGIIYALDRAAELIGGEVEAIVDTGSDAPPRQIKCRIEKLNTLLGTNLSQGEVEDLLARLEMKVAPDCTVSVPSYRNDVFEEIDLIEEVARIYGYNTIEKSHPQISTSRIPHSPLFVAENHIRQRLIAEGLQEFVTCDLISPDQALSCVEKTLPETSLVKVLKPSSIDQSVLRPSLLPGMLASLSHNFDHKTRDISAFEIGRIHFRDGEEYKERPTAAVLLTGKKRPHFWDDKPQTVDFYDMKGIIENVLDIPLSFEKSSFETFHPGIQASIKSKDVTLGVIGQVHPAHFKTAVYFAQFDLQDVLELLPPIKQMEPLPQFPGSSRDITLHVSEETPIDSLLKKIPSSKLLKRVDLLDIYHTEKSKNVTFRFEYRNDTKTVEQAMVDKEHDRLTKNMQ